MRGKAAGAAVASNAQTKVPMTMDGSGFSELSYGTVETAPTGTWTINLYIARDGKIGNQIGSTTVTVFTRPVRYPTELARTA